MSRHGEVIRSLAPSLLISSLVSVGLFAVRVIASGTTRYWYLNWNLFLAWLPLIFAWVFVSYLAAGNRLSSWKSILLIVLLLGLLPNSFYIGSDFIHLSATGEISLLYDVVMLLSFTFNGFLLGFVSLYLFHYELWRSKRARRWSHTVIAIVLLLCSFAIYLGRDLRWNSWDVIINPTGILFDVSDRLIDPAAHINTYTTTAKFFVLLSSIYLVVWQVGKLIRQNSKS